MGDRLTILTKNNTKDPQTNEYKSSEFLEISQNNIS